MAIISIALLEGAYLDYYFYLRIVAKPLARFCFIHGYLGASLIVPNPYMPDKLRLYNAIEIFFQNFPPGIAIAYLLAPKQQA